MKGLNVWGKWSDMVDVTIRGAGIFGLSVAWACVSRGAAVRVIDPGGVASGASGGLMGALAPHTPERWNDKKALQFASLRRAETLWAEVAEASGQDPGYARTGRIQPVGALELAAERARNAEDLWQGRYVWRVAPVAEFAPFAPLTASGLVIHDTLTARVHPRKATRALAAALQARGVEIVPDGAERGSVIHAIGHAGLTALSREMDALVGAPIKGQAALLDYDARDLPQIFVDGLHVVPHGDGTTAIGSTTEREFIEPALCDSGLDDILGRIVRLVPVLKDVTVLERWAGLRPRARSRAPMLGAYPGRAGHFIANGGFKIGFGMAPVVAEMLADLVLEGRDTIPESFRVAASLPKSRG
jgi:glycine oxidase